MKSKIQIDGMLIASFITNVFYTASYPKIHIAVMSKLPDTYLAVNQIVNCLSIIIFSRLWNKYSDKAFRFFPMYCIIEWVTTIGTVLYYVITKSIVGYYILDTLAFAIVSRNIICGCIKLQALRYTTEVSREQYDNNCNSIYALATIIGSTISIWLDIDIMKMLCIAAIGNTLDNIFYICIYYSTKKKKIGDEGAE